jgi:hypothetical protein
LPALADNDSFEQSVLKICEDFPRSRLEILECECKTIDEIRKGVVTLYQPDNAMAVVTLRTLAIELRAAATVDVELIVMNAAAVPFDQMMENFGEKPHSARTFWIRYGKVVFRDESYYLSEQKATLFDHIQAFREIGR